LVLTSFSAVDPNNTGEKPHSRIITGGVSPVTPCCLLSEQSSYRWSGLCLQLSYSQTLSSPEESTLSISCWSALSASLPNSYSRWPDCTLPSRHLFQFHSQWSPDHSTWRILTDSSDSRRHSN
jgi:hypothetical protein